MNLGLAAPALLILWFAVSAALDAMLTGQSEAAAWFVTIVHTVVVATLLYAWTSDDAARRGATLSTAMIFCIVLFNIFAMPFYLANARTSAWRWVLKGIAIFAVCTGGYIGMRLLLWEVFGIGG